MIRAYIIFIRISGDSSGPKLESMCRLDGCREPRKKSDGKSFHDYCCRKRATAAASNGIRRFFSSN